MTRPVRNDAFREEWLIDAVSVIFEGSDLRRPSMTVEVWVGGRPMSVVSEAGAVRAEPGSPTAPAVALDGPPDATLGLLAGYLDTRTAQDFGVRITGDARHLRGLRPTLT
jgi:hypothetical protein